MDMKNKQVVSPSDLATNDENSNINNHIMKKCPSTSPASSHLLKPSAQLGYDSENHSVRWISDIKPDFAAKSSLAKSEMDCNFVPASNSLQQSNRKMRRFVPTCSKDEYYWIKRKKNNEAARKSREKRRQNDMVLARTVFTLLKENHQLKKDLLAVKVKYNDIGQAEIEVMEKCLDDKQFHADIRESLNLWDEQTPGSPVELDSQNLPLQNQQLYQLLKEQYGIMTGPPQHMQDSHSYSDSKRAMNDEVIANKISTVDREWNNNNTFDQKPVNYAQYNSQNTQIHSTCNPINSVKDRLEINCSENGHYCCPDLKVFVPSEANHKTKDDSDVKPSIILIKKSPSEDSSVYNSSRFGSCCDNFNPCKGISPVVEVQQNNPMQERTQKLPYKLRFKLSALQS